MGITQRQEKILNTLIQEYIGTAKPVGSEFLVEKHNFGICPATIRNDMQKLAEMGYICQQHTSAGRVPTDKGYRFFVDELLASEIKGDFFSGEVEKIKKETDESFKFIEILAKKLASFSSGLAFTYLADDDFLLKEGWKEVFHNPEFEEKDYLEKFIDTVEGFEKKIKGIFEKEELSSVDVFIGGERSMLNSKDFSLIVAKGKFSKKEKGMLAVLGPKRMDYGKNLSLIRSLIKTLEKT